MDEKFKLSLSNKIYSAIVVIPSVVFIVINCQNSHVRDRSLGYVLGMIFCSLIFAWIAWRLSRRNSRTASWTFNTLLTLQIFAALGNLSSQAKETQYLRDLEQNQKAYKASMSQSENYLDEQVVKKEFLDKTQQTFTRLAEESTGDDKEYYLIIKDFIDVSTMKGEKWNASFAAVETPEILDFSRLFAKRDFAEQRRLFKDCVEDAQAYKAYFDSVLPDLKQKLDKLVWSRERVKSFLDSAQKEHDQQAPIFIPLMEAKINFGNAMLNMLDILEKGQEHWVMEDGQMIFDDDSLLNEYNQVRSQITEYTGSMETLSAKLLDLI